MMRFILFVCKLVGYPILVILMFLFFVGMWLVVKISGLVAQYFGSHSIRVCNNQLQVPIVYYQQQGSEREVVLCLMSHAAKQSFFDIIQSTVEHFQNKGFKVLYEGVGQLTNEQYASLRTHEQAVEIKLRRMFDGMKHFAHMVGLHWQRDELRYDIDNWVNNDLSRLDVVRLLAAHNATVLESENDDFLDGDISKNEEIFLQFLLNTICRNLLGLVVAGDFFLSLSSGSRAFKTIIRDQRNAVAYDGMNKQFEQGNNVIMIWGALHYKGLDAMLRQDGFVEIGRKWVTVYHCKRRGYFLAKWVRNILN